MSSFKNTLVSILTNHDRKPRVREGGLHASMSGKCPRHVLANFMNEGTRTTYPFTDETKGVFDIGHMFDAWCKKACDEGFYSEGNMLQVVPFRTITKFGDLNIVGEMDLMVLDLANRVIHVVDFKSIGASQFPMQKRENAPKPQHALQVSCYLQSEQVNSLFSTGWGRMGWVAYVSKDDMQVFVAKVQPMYLEACERYWNDIGDCLREGHCPQAGDDNIMVPSEVWECGYCSMYPPIDQKKYTTATAIRQARAVLRESNMRTCMTLPGEFMGIPINTTPTVDDDEPADDGEGPDKMEEGDR